MNQPGSNTMSPSDWEDLVDSLLNSTIFGIMAFDEKGNIMLVNKIAAELLDLDLEIQQLYGKNIWDGPDLLDGFIGRTEQSRMRKMKSFLIESVFYNEKYLNIRGIPLVHGYSLLIENITARKELETLSVHSIITGQENERTRLAREIHDGIGPLLSTVKLELDSFIDEVHSSGSELPIETLFNIREIIDSITNDLRNLSHHLLPRLLEEFGLNSAFNSMINRLKSSKRRNVEYFSNFDTEMRFNKDLELNLYRCGQELLNNAIKHSGAEDILVQLIKHENSIVLMVEDDGIGFEVETPKPDYPGIGLTNVETRVRTLNGEFIIDTSKGRGTSISIEIPL